MPGIVEWPARIPKPFVSETPCSTLDIYPTVLAATGATAEKQIQPLDGINLLPLFDGKMTERGKAIPFVAQITNPNSHAAAYREGAAPPWEVGRRRPKTRTRRDPGGSPAA